MNAGLDNVAPPARSGSSALPSVGLARLASIAFCGVLPGLVLVALFARAIADHAVAIDFRVFLDAADSILRGVSPYPSLASGGEVIARSYVYPPLTALVATPFSLLPDQAAGLLVMALVTACALAAPYVVGVRDWRCYGVLLLWPPVISAIQTGSVTLVMVLATALAWRFRDRVLAVGAAVGVTLATKLFFWPLVVWLVVTRRVRHAVAATSIGVVLLVASWAVIGFAGLRQYPDLLRRLEDVVGLDSYTARIVLLDAGVPGSVARVLWLALGVLVLAGVVLVARRGHERGAFLLAIAAALALTPIVWLHYFALLVVVAALAQPRLGLVWFVPLGMLVTPGSGHPAPWQTAWTLAVAAATIALALRVVLRDDREHHVVRAPAPA